MHEFCEYINSNQDGLEVVDSIISENVGQRIQDIQMQIDDKNNKIKNCNDEIKGFKTSIEDMRIPEINSKYDGLNKKNKDLKINIDLET